MLSKKALGCCAGGGGGAWALMMQFQPFRSTKRPSAFVLAWQQSYSLSFMDGSLVLPVLAPTRTEPQKGKLMQIPFLEWTCKRDGPRIAWLWSQAGPGELHFCGSNDRRCPPTTPNICGPIASGLLFQPEVLSQGRYLHATARCLQRYRKCEGGAFSR